MNLLICNFTLQPNIISHAAEKSDQYKPRLFDNDETQI